MKCLMEQLQDNENLIKEYKEQLDSIEEVVESTALTTEYMACLQEVNAE